MKKVVVFLIVLALVLTLTPALIYAKKGPAEKVTGSIEIEKAGGDRAFAEFNAHEAIGDKSAKGVYHWWKTTSDGTTITREIYIDVTDVMVSGNEASFIGICTYDSLGSSNVDKWFLVEATDGGRPGAGNDGVGWDWFSSEPSFGDVIKAKTIIDGNLVVHSQPAVEVVSVVFNDVGGDDSLF